ncbi:hypothetical protein Scep_006545 [Stephania cephalantha]|uniref:Uncharacterized protein n=1 Tax=Stephania cephalantha TaxID=152367 RepID=A0AAP0PK67_9MAGN
MIGANLLRCKYLHSNKSIRFLSFILTKRKINKTATKLSLLNFTCNNIGPSIFLHFSFTA